MPVRLPVALTLHGAHSGGVRVLGQDRDSDQQRHAAAPLAHARTQFRGWDHQYRLGTREG